MARTTSKISSESDATEPVNLEVETPSTEPTPAKEAESKEKIETDVKSRLSKKTDGEDPFVPSTPAALEAAAKDVAKERGFEITRGTEIGARLMARARKF